MVDIEYMADWGEEVSLVLCAERYNAGGGMAVLALDACDPESEDYLDLWADVTVNLPDDPMAAAWCSIPGNVVLDSNGMSKAMMDALVKSGVVSLSGGAVRSGFCSYPLATISPEALAELRSQEETIAAVMARDSGVAEDPAPAESRESRYMLLDRLAQDCRYFLGGGNAHEACLWAGSVEGQVAKMRELYDSFADDEKPEWISRTEIDGYEVKMVAARDCVSTQVREAKPSPSETARRAAAAAARSEGPAKGGAIDGPDRESARGSRHGAR